MDGHRGKRGRDWSPRQGEFSFLARSRRLDRVFKRVILGTTLALALGLILGTSTGRGLAYRVGFESKKVLERALGLGEDRRAFEAQRDRDRLRGMAMTREALEQVGIDGGPAIRTFLRETRMDHETAVIRWGNFDACLALSSSVFEADEAGRSYKLLPETRSIWLINLTVNNVSAFFEIPDTPEARRLGEAVGGQVVAESVQTTNSWGCRGPEPDLKAPVRGIVLGDSNMQGLLVGDDQTPPVRLEAALHKELGLPVSILNTGVLGYSPEQYYYALMAFHDRFRPQFVVISICNNDFGDMKKPENWAEGEYWLDEIAQFCRTRGIVCIAVPVPQEDVMLGRRDETVFPGQVSRILDVSGQMYVNLIEAFIDEQLTLKARAAIEGRPFPYSPLFNRKYGDNHLSALGSDLWGRLVAHRLRLIWDAQPTRPPWAKLTEG